MTQTLSFAVDPDAEETARAELYGLLAALWLAPPDAALLEQFRVAVTEAPQPGGHLEAPWQNLVAAMRDTTVAAARAEFDALFGGVGKPEVFPYGSWHIAGALNDKPLARLREDLAALGLAREEGHLETEDHVSVEFEVMRWLIAGDDAGVCNLEQQRRFYRNHVQPWLPRLCEAVLAQPRAKLWAAIAAFTAAFIDVETQGFDLLEA